MLLVVMGCGPAPDAPRVPSPAILVVGGEPEAVAPEPAGPVACPEPPEELSAEIVATHRATPCDEAPCRAPLDVVVRNRNQVPLFVIETHVRAAEDAGMIIWSYDPAVFVAPGEALEMPPRLPVAAHSAHDVRVIYLDGWGRERVAQVLVDRERPPPSRRWATAVAAPPCEPSPPPALEPLTVSAPGSCVGCEPETPLVVHNPNAGPLRLIDVWIDQPGGGTVGPARGTSDLIYVAPRSTRRLPHRVGFEAPGPHGVRVTYRDGWGRHHEVHAVVEVLTAP